MARGRPKRGKAKSKGTRSAPRPERMETAAAVPGAEGTSRPAVWRPGVDDMEEGEELQFDPSAYNCLHQFRLNWPCLSLDVVPDSLGDNRKSFPHTLFFVAGTQAPSADGNVVAAVRLANITKMRHHRDEEDEDGEGDDDESESSSDEDDDDPTSMGGEGAGVFRIPKPGKPIMQARSVVHYGGVNRIRSMPQQPHISASWSDSGRVQVWDLTPQVRSLAATASSSSVAASDISPPVARQAPLHIYSGHDDEGFAIDWSPANTARLATGDCKGGIAEWRPVEGGKWVVGDTKFRGHEGSVEDIQWSPSEPEVFASSGVDGTVCFWDVRAASRTAPALRVKAHDADVNVISWNRLASCMVASGCEDGSFRIWDLRLLREAGGGKEGGAFIAHFKHHRQPITAIEWSPHESSTLATSCADNQITIWDLSLERDAEEEAEYEAGQRQPQAEAPSDLPPQLLFVHQGQTDIKEVHWHPHIPGMLLSTAADGFNAFMPSNL
ncbi:hypothetical protein CLOM_g13004 [Closterium sp. NIES-68]|nr:hypothetical protein CLOM_g13004 [Closterium sp. NIES-68]